MSSFMDTFSSASNYNVAFGTDAATSFDETYSVLDYLFVSSYGIVPFPLIAEVYCSSTSWYKI